MSVSHKINLLSVSLKIVKNWVFLRGAYRRVLAMVCDGCNWCQMYYMLRNYHGTWAKTEEKKRALEYFVTYIHFLLDLQTHDKIVLNDHNSTKPVWTYILLCLISVFFNAQMCQLGTVWYLVYIFAFILMFLVPSDHGVDKLYAWKHMLFLILFELLILDSYTTTKVKPSIIKIE